MNKEPIFLGSTEIKSDKAEVKGNFVEIDGEKFYRISNYSEMPDFFMTIVSNTDHWMFISSNGSLSAGRKNRDNALFPYYTVDKIHDYRGKTGSKTCCLVKKNNRTFLWEPFTEESAKAYNIQRNLYKSIYGNKILFEEVNNDLEISFQYGWFNSEKYGWIRRSLIKSFSSSGLQINILDGIRNVLPYGIEFLFQSEYSNLADAYKKNELLESSNLGLFMLSSIPVDRAEPSEALKATTIWSHGLDRIPVVLISDKQLANFNQGLPVETETDIRASRGAYYISSELDFENQSTYKWYLVAEINQDSTDVSNLDAFIRNEKNIEQKIIDDIQAGTDNLVKVVASADGLQSSNEELCSTRHFSNTLFNIMRGGVFTNNYLVEVRDVILYINQTNRNIRHQFREELENLPETIQYKDLLSWAQELNNPDLERICQEYLPLTFSRRHGDPSRPWNLFSIDIKNDDGTDKLTYQGNWRDIFQNWEALSLSFPGFLEGMLGKFLNASTADGYNPYRITREGIDWEIPNPNEPWAFIGYWGDHQIIYLQKLLEQLNDFDPGKLDNLLTREIFVFANVPYRIKPFGDIADNPKETIVFDFDLNAKIEELTGELGADGRLLYNPQNEIIRTNLTEKILVTLLAKLSNFIPEAGIWLNTQRPEWNDANNALVGNGVSMVTLYYLRRFLKFWERIFSQTSVSEIVLSEEVKTLLDKIQSLFTDKIELVEKGFSDEDRYDFTCFLGNAGSEYRNAIYNQSFSGKKAGIRSDALLSFIQLSLKYVDQSIKTNKRKDGLYHAYNLISIESNTITIRYLYEMLEGQVAVLSSGSLPANESLEVMKALKSSSMFRADQNSYMLYPDRQLPLFTNKNNIPKKRIAESVLLQKLIADKNNPILRTDDSGNAHFSGLFRNAFVLEEALGKLDKQKYGDLVSREKDLILGIYEEMFDHQSFTGRSGTFYGYEGLGSIYWHMVSKLLLASQESYLQGIDDIADQETIDKIKDHYNEIKDGIGLYKSPELYGAFPTDAYSHTPANSGVKQPGLTGQVKEDIITRLRELGLLINNGKITFIINLLNRDELLKQSVVFNYYDIDGNMQSIELQSDQLGYTFCQVPVIYTLGREETIVIHYRDGESKELPVNQIPEEISSKIFSRSGEVKRIDYKFK